VKTFKLHLIRHGVTEGNLQGLYIGSGTDLPLCQEGRAQLEQLRQRFVYPEVDTVFSSPLVRAVETAAILFPQASHQFTVHDLREAGFGSFEGKPVRELVKTEEYKQWITPGSGFVPEGAEPTADFHRRCADPGCGYTVQTDVQLWMRDRLVEAIDIVPFGYADTLRGQEETERAEAYE